MSGSLSGKTSPPVSQGDFPLGINTKFAATPARPSSAKPRPARVSGQQAATGKNLIVSSEQEKARRFRYFLAMRQREAIYRHGLAGKFKSLCSCGAFAVPAFGKSKKTGEMYFTGAPGSVQLQWRKNAEDEEARLVHSWVKHCASPLLCFIDAPKIRWYRSNEVKKICKMLYEAGYCWQFWTFTAPHDLESDPKKQVKLFQEAMRVFKEHFDRFKKKWKLRFYIRAVEMTDDAYGPGRKSGCHFHHHFVVFFEREGFADDEIKEIQAFLSARWIAALMKVGLCGEEKKKSALKWAFRLDVPRRPKHISEDDLQAVAEYLAKGAGFELTPGIGVKKGHGYRRITHWEVMRLAFTTTPALEKRALAIMLALKGRAWLQFSRGLKAFCGLDDISDEEILKEKNNFLVYEYDEDDWRDMDQYKGQVALQSAIVGESVLAGIDLTALPLGEDKKNLDMESREIRKIQQIAEASVSKIARTGCDPLTGEDLTVDPRPMLPLADP